MTEAEWQAADERGRRRAVDSFGPRRTRLFAVVACRSLGRWVDDPAVVAALDAAEAFADGTITKAALGRARAAVRRVFDGFSGADPGMPDNRRYNATEAATRAASENQVSQALDTVLFVTASDGLPHFSEACRVIYRLYEEFAGPAIRVFDPAWRTLTAVAIATGTYADRAFDRLPVLADALEDAGCDAAELLAHLRGPGPHARDCWALDAVLGKT